MTLTLEVGGRPARGHSPLELKPGTTHPSHAVGLEQLVWGSVTKIDDFDQAINFRWTTTDEDVVSARWTVSIPRGQWNHGPRGDIISEGYELIRLGGSGGALSLPDPGITNYFKVDFAKAEFEANFFDFPLHFLVTVRIRNIRGGVERGSLAAEVCGCPSWYNN